MANHVGQPAAVDVVAYDMPVGAEICWLNHIVHDFSLRAVAVLTGAMGRVLRLVCRDELGHQQCSAGVVPTRV